MQSVSTQLGSIDLSEPTQLFFRAADGAGAFLSLPPFL